MRLTVEGHIYSGAAAMGTHSTCYPGEAGPTCGTARRKRDGAPPEPAAGLRAVVPHVALHFVCGTHCRSWEQVQIKGGLGVVALTAVGGRKTQAGLVGHLSPWLSVILEAEGPKPMRADVVMVAGH